MRKKTHEIQKTMNLENYRKIHNLYIKHCTAHHYQTIAFSPWNSPTFQGISPGRGLDETWLLEASRLGRSATAGLGVPDSFGPK